MSTIDDHWCTKCGKALDKVKDQYFEMNTVNEDAKKRKNSGQHTRVILCLACIEKEPEMAAAFEKLRKHGNPNFLCTVTCGSTHECENYEPGNAQVNCKYIYVAQDKIYCGRRHPGSVTMTREQSKIMDDLAESFGQLIERSQPGGDLDVKNPLLAQGLKFSEGLFRGAGGNANFSDILKRPDAEIIVDENLVAKKE